MHITRLSYSAALCPVPDNIENGIVTSSTGASVGDTATYTCNPGFELIGDATTTCTQVDVNSAAFVPQPPVCRREFCMNVTGIATEDQPVHTLLMEGWFHFVAIKFQLILCLSNSAALCLVLLNIDNGTVTSTGMSIGDTATYTCNPGFELIGTATLTCILEDTNFATFQPAAPVCRREFIL